MERPLARFAAIADAKLQPVPCVLLVSSLCTGSSVTTTPSHNRSNVIPAQLPPSSPGGNSRQQRVWWIVPPVSIQTWTFFRTNLKGGCRIPLRTDLVPQCAQEEGASNATFVWSIGHHLAHFAKCLNVLKSYDTFCWSEHNSAARGLLVSAYELQWSQNIESKRKKGGPVRPEPHAISKWTLFEWSSRGHTTKAAATTRLSSCRPVLLTSKLN